MLQKSCKKAKKTSPSWLNGWIRICSKRRRPAAIHPEDEKESVISLVNIGLTYMDGIGVDVKWKKRWKYGKKQSFWTVEQVFSNSITNQRWNGPTVLARKFYTTGPANQIYVWNAICEQWLWRWWDRFLQIIVIVNDIMWWVGFANGERHQRIRRGKVRSGRSKCGRRCQRSGSTNGVWKWQ